MCTASVTCTRSRLSARLLSETCWISRYLLPRLNLRVIPNAWYVLKATSLRSNEGSLGNQQSTRYARALLVVLDSYIAMYMCLVGTEARQRRERNPMLYAQLTNAQGLRQYAVVESRGHTP